jgi:hypothetical protein
MPGYPMLVAAIRSSGHLQWRIAEMARMPEWRLSTLVRRGGATPDERARLSDLLGVSEAILFGAGLAVTVKFVETSAPLASALPVNASDTNTGLLSVEVTSRGTRSRKSREGFNTRLRRVNLVDAQSGPRRRQRAAVRDNAGTDWHRDRRRARETKR